MQTLGGSSFDQLATATGTKNNFRSSILFEKLPAAGAGSFDNGDAMLDLAAASSTVLLHKASMCGPLKRACVAHGALGAAKVPKADVRALAQPAGYAGFPPDAMPT